MAATDAAILAFNRGIVSKLGLARVDVKRISLAAEQQENWIPRVLGSMMLRPGFGYLGATLNNAAAKFLPFVFSTTDTALIELTNLTARVWVSDALVTRVAVGTAITNGTFPTDLTGWTSKDDAGGTSSWVAPNYMSLVGNGTAYAAREQQVTVAAGDQNKEHALRIVIVRGPVTLMVGSTSGGDDYIAKTDLKAGTHSLAFTPTGNFYVRFKSNTINVHYVSQCTVEAAGVMTLPTVWPAASLSNVRWDQSADVIFAACDGFQQQRIERRGTHSWSVVKYAPEDGPFRVQNVSTTTIAPSALTGNVTLTASQPTFYSTHVGALFSVTSVGQIVTQSVTAENTFSNSIKVTGVGTTRTITIILTGTWVATVSLQFSLDNVVWSDVPAKTWTANVNTSYADGLDNQIIYYRIGVKTGGFTSGTVSETLSIPTGSITGIARVTAFTSSTVVSAEVLTAMGGTTASAIWAEGEWSDFRGWPTCVVFYEGRLWWAGRNGVWGSVSDAFESYDGTTVGDSGPISRTVGSGPVDVINWLMPLQRLLLGAQGSELSARSTSFEEPLTPTNFNIHTASTQGSSAIPCLKIDSTAAYVQRGGARVFELAFDLQTYEYTSTQLTALCPDLGSPGLTRSAVQRQPDTRMHFVRSDGKVMAGIFDKVEQVLCWVLLSSTAAGGIIEDVVTLPAQSPNLDDQVYFVVNRTVNGATVRYLEKWALESEARGGTVNKIADAFVVYNGVAATVITGLSHLEGQKVCVWADGKDIGTDANRNLTYTVAGGQITLANAASYVVVGLPYSAQFQSAKLAWQLQAMGTPLGRQKKVNQIVAIMADVHPNGLRYGPDFSNLDELPEVYQAQDLRGAGLLDTIISEYDDQSWEFKGQWGTDSRLCMQADAPRPCTVLAAVMEYEVRV